MPENTDRPKGLLSEQNANKSASVSNERASDSSTSVFPADSTVICRSTVSLPAWKNWPGDYGFDVSFPSHDTIAKRFDWMYSSRTSKLYVIKDMPCPVNFSTCYKMPEGTSIRATAVFTSPEHASEVVQRCVNHCIEDANKGVPYPDHLIRCECHHASYEEDPATDRHSVVLPFENPQSGEKFSTYIFKFVCWGSCTGGLNRRPIAVVFTLEHGGQVIGRRFVEVRICACPLRDRRADEKSLQPDIAQVPGSKKRKPTENIFSVEGILNFINCDNQPSPKKMKHLHAMTDGSYVISVPDRQQYKFLKAMKHFYEIRNTLKIASTQFQKNASNSSLLKKGRKTGDFREAK